MVARTDRGLSSLCNGTVEQDRALNEVVEQQQRVIGYARVSTQEQKDSGLGMAAQERAIKSEVKRRGWKLVEILRDEGESGKSLDRPGFRHALELIAAGEADGLMASKLDRITRSLGDLADLMEWFGAADAALVALDVGVDTSTPGGKLVCSIFGSVAAWEADTIAARTRDGLASLRAKGKPISRAAVSDNPKLAKRIKTMRAKGKTYQAIADALNKAKVPTLRGAPQWTVSSVRGAAGYNRPTTRRRPARLPVVKRRPPTRRAISRSGT